ncbi:hypothetical protein KOI35_23140 [Actinoplanes bogorensis]|uniref:Uncharacterized protein n=1 Tax=Paractinoplanes bogorensis TaxID=1610840 RepID=A0ABS5YSH9_9ACTN|nr:hypothetical protein [Actinoplanes bogorensis]MBU2666404.1 hypothetical protein [Actinoplanes bogorensis]
MAITLQGLLAADTGRLQDAARHWDRLAFALDTAVEDLGRHTRDLPHVWPAGPSSTAAQRRLVDLRMQLGNGYGHCVAIAAIIREFAGAVEHNRRLLHGLVAEAQRAGLRIDLWSGLITVPIQVAATQSTVDSYAQQIGQILAQVVEADRRATEQLDEHNYREEFIPDATRPEYDQTGLLALAGWEPRSQASWWRAQHPLMQDRAIVEHPEIVGAAVGLPAKDRDSANRLLLRRTRAELLARDARGGQAQLAVDKRLAALDDLERRHRGRRLLEFTP